jgi:hypothetical protein
MNKLIKTATVLTISLLITSCASSDCTKTITIPERTTQTQYGSSYIPAYDLEVPCDYVITPVTEQPKLKEFSYEVLQFEFTPDTGRNTARLQYSIKLNNLSTQTVKGFPVLTTDADGVVILGSYRTDSCAQLAANSSCIVSYDKEFALDLNVGFVKAVKLLKVEYYISQ